MHIVIGLALMVVAWAVAIASMVIGYGYGLSVQSWLAVILLPLVSVVIASLGSAFLQYRRS